MIDQINELPEDGLKSSPETLCYTENKCHKYVYQFFDASLC